MPRPMDLGRAVLFAGSALLLISLFTEWYDIGLTGWEVFETLDLVLAALAIGGMVASVRPDLLPPWSGFALPGAAIFVVAVQLIDGPPAAGDASPSGGAWVALAGAFLMGAGSALSLSAISVTVQFRERDIRRRIPAVDRRNDDVDLDAEDDPAAAADSAAAAPPESLFATTLSGGEPRRTGRFNPRSTGPEPATAAARADAAASDPAASRGGAAGDSASSLGGGSRGGAASGGAPSSATAPAGGADDLERTQPLAGLPDDADEPERP